VSLMLFGMGILLSGAVLVLLLSRSHRDGAWLGAGPVVVAALLGGIPAVRVLLGGAAESLRLPWPVPFGEFFIELDPLTAWFLLPTLLLSALSAVYGVGYLRAWQGRRALGPVWFFYGLLVLGMMLVLLARNAVLFLFAWELMAVASFFLVTFEHEHEAVREAGWIYFVATHLGTAFLLVFFLLIARETGSMDFADWAEQGVSARGLAGVLFLLALIGFGTKAGLMPFHVWLPEAHPAAPSHVSALMSGVMIKTGVYGLLRSLTFLGAPEAWWGWVLLGIGLASGVLGILFALAQHDLKRLLAYSSVENIGLITAGLGLGLLGVSYQQPLLAALGFAGALVHVLNHSLFKGLLFLGAGSVAHATGTRQMDRLGGLLKQLPWTGGLFLLGAVAICGLPPLNGFISELLLAGSALSAMTANPVPAAIAGLLTLACLGLIGGLAAATFAKAFGIVFLGEPRHPLGTAPPEAGLAMRVPMILLALGCVALAPGAVWLVKWLVPISSRLSGFEAPTLLAALRVPTDGLVTVSVCGLVLAVVVAAIAFFRGALLAGRTRSVAGTWDCGFLRPTARMQYTASSFAQPVTSLFRWLLGVRYRVRRPDGLLPPGASLETETPDLCRGNLYHPAFLKANWGLSKLRWLQSGQVQLYVLYIAVTLIVLLAWKFR
jgi:hydrogenase-4 component B